MTAGGVEHARDDLGLDGAPRCLEALVDERRKRCPIDDAELHLLRASPERLVGVAEELLNHAALAAEVHVGNLRLRLEDRTHQPRQVRVQVEDLLELVEHERRPPASLRRQLRGKLQKLLERRVDVRLRVSGREAEAE
jgi:hypothetical protein